MTEFALLGQLYHHTWFLMIKESGPLLQPGKKLPPVRGRVFSDEPIELIDTVFDFLQRAAIPNKTCLGYPKPVFPNGVADPLQKYAIRCFVCFIAFWMTAPVLKEFSPLFRRHENALPPAA